MSKKQATEARKYSGPGGTREQHLKAHPQCQFKLIGCTIVGTTVHHTAKRGKNLNNKETFMTACAHCHHQVEFVMSAAARRKEGYLV